MVGLVLSFSLNALAAPEYDDVAFKTNLKYGMKKNMDVMNLQAFLTMNGYLVAMVPTGNFYQQTLSAVKKYQQNNNLPVTGFVGSMTRALLNQQMKDHASQSNCIGTAPCITILSPNNGADISLGSTQTIKWITMSVPLDTWVALELKKGNESGQLIVQKIPVNQRQYTWKVPVSMFGYSDYNGTIVGGDGYKIVAKVYQGTNPLCGGMPVPNAPCATTPSTMITADESDTVFSIK